VSNFSSDSQVSPSLEEQEVRIGNADLDKRNLSAQMTTVLDAWDFTRRAAAPAVFGGLTNNSLTNFDFYLDPSIIWAALMVDQATLRWTINPLRVAFDAAGLATAPSTVVGDATVSVTLAYTPIVGWAIVARAVDTQSGQSTFSLTTSTNGFSGSWNLAKIDQAGVVFVWQASRSQSRAIAWPGGTPDGTATPTANPNELIFDPLTSGAMILSGANISLDVFPVVLTDIIKKGLIVNVANDSLNNFAVGIAKGIYGS